MDRQAGRVVPRPRHLDRAAATPGGVARNVSLLCGDGHVGNAHDNRPFAWRTIGVVHSLLSLLLLH